MTYALARTKEGVFVVDDRDRFVGQQLLAGVNYGAEELALWRTCVTSKSDALVVGAHVGSLAIPLSHSCRSVVAIEANPFTIPMLRANVILNGRHNVELCFGAANDTGDGTLQFLCGTDNSGGSKRMPVELREDYVYDNPVTVTVPTLKLDEICAGRKFDFVHLDIEGSEVFALRGAQTLLPHVKYLSVEFISHHLTAVAGVTVDEWLAPIAPHFNMMLMPGSVAMKRPDIYLEPADWREMLQSIVDAGAGIEGIVFWNK